MSEGRVKSINVECGLKESPPHFYAFVLEIITKPNVRRMIIQIFKYCNYLSKNIHRFTKFSNTTLNSKNTIMQPIKSFDSFILKRI